MTVSEWLRHRLLSKVRPDPPIGLKQKDLQDEGSILDDHASVEFLTLMMNRLVLGYFRYGPRKVRGRRPTQNIKEIRRRITLYEKTGNQEHLVDVANFALVEFMKPCHENAHFGSQDDGVHAEYKEA